MRLLLCVGAISINAIFITPRLIETKEKRRNPMNSNQDVYGSQLNNNISDQGEEDDSETQMVVKTTLNIKKISKTLLFSLVAILGLLTLSVSTQEVKAQSNALTIPAQSEWVDHGSIFTAGAEGEWDNILWGGFAGCVTKMNGQFYLYYQGSDGYDDTQGTVTNRAIGLATSSDGLNFQKDPSNPVITHSPNNSIEEGAVSCGVSMNSSEMVMYYGANTVTYPGSPYVNANGIAATSTDGRTFTDEGIALQFNDSSLWGSGDEVFPVMALKAPETNQWIVYYIPNGVPETRTLGVAWGNRMLNLSNSAGATDSNGNVAAWGMGGGVVSLQDGTYAVFTNNVSTQQMEARIMDPNSPSHLSNPVQTYNFADFNSGVVFFDAASNTWFLYYRNSDASAYGVKTAPGPSSTPENQPPTVSAGPDQTAELDGGTAFAYLSGTASDDGLPDPPGALSIAWSMVSGPASVSFENPNNLSTTAAFNAEGSYLLELAVSDGEYTVTDRMTVSVVSPPSAPACQVDTAEWNRGSIRDGHKVHLIANTSNCDGGVTVRMDIYEVLGGGQSPVLVGSLMTTIGGNGQVRESWTAVYNCDEPGIDCPDNESVAVYYFEAYVTGNSTQVATSQQLTVSP
jgi:hypothetical protein